MYFFKFDVILKAINSSFQKGMTVGRSIYVKKVMKVLAFGSFTIKCTLGSCLCYSGCSMLSVYNLEPKYFSLTHKSLLDPSKWYIT